MTKRYVTVLIFLSASAAFAAIPLKAEATTLHLSPSSGSYYRGENFEVRIVVDSDVTVNAVSSVLDFPTQRLTVVDVSKKNSVLNFWVEEPSFSNSGALGNIRFGGVALNPGFVGNNKNIATIIFRADNTGAADVNFSQSAILANDGLGTNVGASTAGAHFTVLPQRASRPSPTQEPQVIFVQELPQENQSNVLFFWGTMPEWVKISVAVFIGLATIIFSLIILSLGAIVLVWLWSNLFHRRYQILSFLLSLVNAFKKAIRTALRFFGMAGEEVKEDVYYGVHRLMEEVKLAPHLSFKTLIKDYFSTGYDIAKRFFTKNVTEDMDKHTHERPDRNVQSDTGSNGSRIHIKNNLD